MDIKQSWNIPLTIWFDFGSRSIGSLKIIPIVAGLMIALTSLFHANSNKTNNIQSDHQHFVYSILWNWYIIQFRLSLEIFRIWFHANFVILWTACILFILQLISFYVVFKLMIFSSYLMPSNKLNVGVWFSLFLVNFYLILAFFIIFGLVMTPKLDKTIGNLQGSIQKICV